MRVSPGVREAVADRLGGLSRQGTFRWVKKAKTNPAWPALSAEVDWSKHKPMHYTELEKVANHYVETNRGYQGHAETKVSGMPTKQEFREQVCRRSCSLRVWRGGAVAGGSAADQGLRAS